MPNHKENDIVKIIRSILSKNKYDGAAAQAWKEHDNKKNHPIQSYLLDSLTNTYKNTINITGEEEVSISLSKNGSIILENKPKSLFFKKKTRYFKKDDLFFSRGYDYCIFDDDAITDINSYLDQYRLIFEDANNSLISGNTSREEMIALLDYTRIYLLVLFHAVIFTEKLSGTTFSYKNNLFTCLYEAVSDFYDALYFAPTKLPQETNYISLVSFLPEVFTFLRKNKAKTDFFKYPELDHPELIIKFCLSVLSKEPLPELISGIISGGTETAMLLHRQYEIKSKKEINFNLLSISRYTSSKIQDAPTHSSVYDAFNKKNNDSKNALIIDDNSNTGQTLLLAQKYFTEKGLKTTPYVVEFDPHRALYKHNNFQSGKEMIANPRLFNCSVNKVPITYNEKNLLPFRQLRKYNRKRIILDSHLSKLNHLDVPHPNTSSTETGIRTKMCGTHNLYDFMLGYNAGIRWFGIHCLYDYEKYAVKIAALNSKIITSLYNHKTEYEIDKSTKLPVLEIDSIRTMISTASQKNLPATFVFLIEIEKETERTLKEIKNYLLPRNFNQYIVFQIQSRYSPKKTKAFNKTAKQFFSKYGIMQTISAQDKNRQALLKKINTDPCINYVLLDSHQYGGTGIMAKKESQVVVVQKCKKPLFIGGGFTADNIGEFVEGASSYSTNFSIDVETGLEKEKEIYYNNTFKELWITRKDSRKIYEFIENNKEAHHLRTEREKYEALDFKRTKSTFKSLFDGAWRLSEKKYGYYSPRGFSQELTLCINNSYCKKIYNDVLQGLISYNHLPSTYQRKTDLSLHYKKTYKSPWLIEGASSTIEAMIKNPLIKNIFIWTKGEGEDEGVEEQYYKYHKSGLREIVINFDLEKKVSFCASPYKENIIPPQPDHHTVIIDDKIESLENTTNALLKKRGDLSSFSFVYFNHKKDKLLSNDVVLAKDHLELQNILNSFQSSINVYCDLDGVLIHEKFRNIHQPKNLYFHLLHRKLVDDTDLYSQKQSLEDIIPVVDNKITQKFSGKIILISGPSGSGKSTLLGKIKKDYGVTFIPRLTTREKRFGETSGSETYHHVNQGYFKLLAENNALIEYGYFGPGYYGTRVKDFLSALKRNNSQAIFFEADVDTVLYMKDVCHRLDISATTVIVLPLEIDKIDQSQEVLKERIQSRDESIKQEDLEGRLKKGEYTLSKVNDFDHIVINKTNNMDMAIEQLKTIIF